MPDPKGLQTTIAAAMSFTLYIGAANYDATPAQRVALRKRITPLLERYKADGDEGPLRRAVEDVMPEGWAPSGEWAAMLGALES